MRTYSLSFAGGDEIVVRGGTYLRLLSTTAVVNMTVWRSGGLLAEFSSVQQGLAWESLNDKGELFPFDEVRIASATAQTVQVAIGFGRCFNDATSGNVTITGGALTPTTLSGTAAYERNSASAALGTIVAPATNVNGVRINLGWVTANGIDSRLMIATAAPGTWQDGACVLFHRSGSSSADCLSFPVLVPAGYGIYEQASGAGVATMVGLNYTVL